MIRILGTRRASGRSGGARGAASRAGIAALAAALAASAAATPSRAEEKVVFGVPTVTSVSFSTYFLAQKAGFFKQEGIDVEILNFRGAAVVASQLLNGRLTIAWHNPAWLIQARQPGKDYVPIKFYYNQNRTSVWEYVVPQTSPITTLADLKGKVLGMPNLASGTIPITRAMLKSVGLGKSDYQIVAVGQGMPAFRALNGGRVNLLGTIVPIRMRMSASGMKLRLLHLPDRYATLPSLGFAARDDMFKSKPNVLIGFARAVAKATIFCSVNKEACVRAYWAMRPDAAPPPEKQARQLAVQSKILTRYLALQMRLPGGDESMLGEYSDRIWRQYIDILHDAGQIQKTNIPMDSLYTKDLLFSINDFDAGAVRAMARNWK